MMKTLLVAAGLAALAGAPTSAEAQTQAQPPAVGQPCAYADLVGLWESYSVLANETGVESRLARAPRTYMRFSADGAMTYYGFTVYGHLDWPETDAAKIRNTLDAYDGPKKLAYKAQMSSPGLLLYRRDLGPAQGFTCAVTASQAGRPSLLMTQPKGGPPTRRAYRRID
jgi:hypothetical protein